MMCVTSVIVNSNCAPKPTQTQLNKNYMASANKAYTDTTLNKSIFFNEKGDIVKPIVLDSGIYLPLKKGDWK